MERFGVSRTVVREAISKLQAAGLVETRHGIGTFVLAQSESPSFRVHPGQLSTLHDVIALLELRISIETEAAALAAVRRTEANLRVMQDAMSAFSSAIEEGRHDEFAGLAVNSPRTAGDHPRTGRHATGLFAAGAPGARKHPECDCRARRRVGPRGHAHPPFQQPGSAQKRRFQPSLKRPTRVNTHHPMRV